MSETVQKAAVVRPPEEFFSGQGARKAASVDSEAAGADSEAAGADSEAAGADSEAASTDAASPEAVAALKQIIVERGACIGRKEDKSGSLAETEEFRRKCCAVCPVLDDCHAYGMTEEGLEQLGVLGGMTYIQRRRSNS